jgi:hypothetical protein
MSVRLNQTRDTTQKVSGFEKTLVETGDAIHKQFKKIVSSIQGLDCQEHSVFDHSDSGIAGSKPAICQFYLQRRYANFCFVDRASCYKRG